MTWESVRTSYDRVAARYEAHFVDELAGKPRDRELLDAFAAAAGDPVIEVGCGPGQIGRYVRDRGRRVIGADLSPAMATLAAGRLDASVAADMRALPLASGVASGLVAFYALIHVPRSQLGLALRELHRVLRPGGHVLLSAHEGRGDIERDELLGEAVPFVATLFELDELVAATSDAGLDVVHAERRAPYASEAQTFRLYLEAVRPS